MKTDEQLHVLLRNLIQGDVSSFEEVYRKFNRKIYWFSYRYLQNKEEAESLVQEVFMKLWENHQKIRNDSNLNAWLFTVTFNAIRKHFRNLTIEKKHLEIYSTRMDQGCNDDNNEPEYIDLLEKSICLIDKLPPQQKRIFLLHKDKGFSSAEMADQLNLSKKTVENHLFRARIFLRKAMTVKGLLSILL